MTTEEDFQMDMTKDIVSEMLIDIEKCISTATIEELGKVQGYFVSIFKMFLWEKRKNMYWLDREPKFKWLDGEQKYQCLACDKDVEESLSKGQVFSCKCGFLVATEDKSEGYIMCNRCHTNHCSGETEKGSANSIQNVMDYILESEMEGKEDEEDSWYPIYVALNELKEKVLNEMGEE